MFEALIVLLLSATITSTAFLPSREALKIAFEHGQKFYVIEDYRQAIRKFQVVKEAERSRFVDEEKILVEVGETQFPVRVAATYQLGNCYRNLAAEDLKKVEEEVDEEEMERLRERSRERFRKAAEYFEEAAEISKLAEIKVLSQYQLIKASYQGKDYERTIAEAQTLLDRYPKSDYVDEALYNMGWAYYELKRYDSAIDAFERLIARSPTGYRADRALFQIGKSYYDQGKYHEARVVLQRLLDKHDFSLLTQAERLRMETEKLSGVVKETVIELSAKAQRLIGDSYQAEGDVQKAVEAYRTVISKYPGERKIVEGAYLGISEAYFGQGDLEAGIREYKRAIDEVPDRVFRARMQHRIARRYYDEALYRKAIDEYRLYIKGYADVADAAGFGLDRAQFQIAQSFYELAEQEIAAGKREKAKTHHIEAREEYQKVLDLYPNTALRVPALFGMALSAQRAGGPEDIQQALSTFKTILEQFPAEEQYASRSLLQMARIYYGEKDYEKSAAAYEAFVERYPDLEDLDRAYLELAMCYRDAERGDRALEAAGRVDPKSDLFDESRLLMGELLIEHGRYDEAEAALKEALEFVGEKVETAPDIHYGLARIYFEKRDYEAAVEEFTLVMNRGKKGPVVQSAIFGRGSSYYQLEDYFRAAKDFEHLLSQNPPPGLKDQTYRLLSRCYVKLGKREEAIEDYKIIIESSEDPAERAEFTLLLSELYYSMGRYDETIENARKVLKSEFEDSSEERGYFTKERAHFIIGDSFLRKGDFRSAIRTFKEGMSRFPDSALSPDMLFGMGIAYFNMENYDEAIPRLRSFIAKYSDNLNLENAYYFLSYSYLKSTIFEGSAEWFGKLVEKFPQSDLAPEAQFQQGESYFNLRDYSKALRSYQGVLEVYPNSEFVDDALYNVGWCYFELNRASDAFSSFKQLLERFPDSRYAASAQFTLGDYHFNQREYDEATAAYRAVISEYSGSKLVPEARKLIGELDEIRSYLKYSEAMEMFDKGRYKEAIERFQKVIEAFPKSDSKVGALANMGMSYEFLHEWRNAVETYDLILKDYADDPEHSDAVAFAKEHRDWIVANRL